MYTLMFFKSPFSPFEKLAQINATVKYPSESALKFSKEVIDLLKSMLKKDPAERIGSGEVWSVIDSLKEKIA